MKKIVLVCCVLACGGVKTPPTQFSVASSFTPEEKEVVRDAVSAWCDATGWCPEEVSPEEKVTTFVHESLEATDFECPEGNNCFIAGENRGDYVAINNKLHDLNTLWFTIAHEIGHFCIEGHADTGLMSDYYQSGEGEMKVDEVAVTSWERGCD